MPIRAVIFDYGGVIVRMVDETPRQQLAEHYRTDLDTLYQVIFESESAKRSSGGEISFAQHWQYVCEQLHIPETDQIAMLEAFLAADSVDRDLVAWVRELHEQYKIGLLSNAWDNLRGLLVDRWQVAGEFDDLVISAEVGLVKPDRRIYELAVRRLGVLPEEAVFFDDVLENVLGARRAGLQAYQYTDVDEAKRDFLGLSQNRKVRQDF